MKRLKGLLFCACGPIFPFTPPPPPPYLHAPPPPLYSSFYDSTPLAWQVVTEYGEGELERVLEACESMTNHLTAAVVSNDVAFQRRVLAHTVNGTTYCGIRARQGPSLHADHKLDDLERARSSRTS